MIANQTKNLDPKSIAINLIISIILLWTPAFQLNASDTFTRDKAESGIYEDSDLTESSTPEKSSIHVSSQYFFVSTTGLILEMALGCVSPTSLFEIIMRSAVLYPSLFAALTSNLFMTVKDRFGPALDLIYENSIGVPVNYLVNSVVDWFSDSVHSAKGIIGQKINSAKSKSKSSFPKRKDSRGL